MGFLLFLFGNLQINDLKNVPQDGPYLLVVNHMSKADPALIMYAMPGVRLRFFAGEKWKRHLLFGPLLGLKGGIFIQRGEVDRAALKEALDSLRQGGVFGLAPEGTRSRVGALIQARDGAAYLATRSDVPILPVGIINTDIIGYKMAHLRKTDLTINFGKPFKLPDLDRRPKGEELAAYTHLIMVHIAALLPEHHRGYYANSDALKALLSGEDPWPYCLEQVGVLPIDS